MTRKAMIIALATACATLMATGAQAQNRTELRLAHHMPLTNHMHTSAEEIAAWFNERSDAYEIKVFGGGQLFTEKALVDAVVSGGLDMGFTTAAWWGAYSPSIHVLNAPMLLDTYAKAHAALEGGMGEALAGEIEQSGVRVLGWIHSGIDSALVNNVKQIDSIDDFEGMRIRTSFPMVAAVLEELGAGAVVMSSSEVYTALQRGTFDGTFTGAPSARDRKWIEVTEYGTFMPLYFSAHPFVVAGSIYDSMPEEEQALLREAVERAGAASSTRAEETETAAWEVIRGANEVVEMSPEDKAKIAEIATRASLAYLEEVAGARGVEIYKLAQDDIAATD